MNTSAANYPLICLVVIRLTDFLKHSLKNVKIFPTS